MPARSTSTPRTFTRPACGHRMPRGVPLPIRCVIPQGAEDRVEIPETVDGAVLSAAHAALRELNDVRLREVSFHVHRGLLRLIGHVQTYYAKQIVLNAVSRIAGVRGIVDEIDVKSRKLRIHAKDRKEGAIA